MAPGHGGTRPGAGRKPRAAEPSDVQVCMYLTKTEAIKVRRFLSKSGMDDDVPLSTAARIYLVREAAAVRATRRPKP